MIKGCLRIGEISWRIFESFHWIYLDVTAAGRVLDVDRRSDFGLGFVLEVQFAALDLLVTATRFVCRIAQGADFRLGVPTQFLSLNLQSK